MKIKLIKSHLLASCLLLFPLSVAAQETSPEKASYRYLSESFTSRFEQVIPMLESISDEKSASVAVVRIERLGTEIFAIGKCIQVVGKPAKIDRAEIDSEMQKRAAETEKKMAGVVEKLLVDNPELEKTIVAALDAFGANLQKLNTPNKSAISLALDLVGQADCIAPAIDMMKDKSSAKVAAAKISHIGDRMIEVGKLMAKLSDISPEDEKLVDAIVEVGMLGLEKSMGESAERVVTANPELADILVGAMNDLGKKMGRLSEVSE